MDGEVVKVEPPASLYRHFDANGSLLYIGVSLSTMHRLSEHQDHSHWFKQISRVEIEHYGSRALALQAERVAIKAEKPKHNIRHRWSQRDEAETQAQARYEIARQELTRTVVFHPVYHIEEVARVLGVSVANVMAAIERNELGAFELPPKQGLSAHGKPFKPKIAVTGWQLIDYLQAQESKHGPGAQARTDRHAGAR